MHFHFVKRAVDGVMNHGHNPSEHDPLILVNGVIIKTPKIDKFGRFSQVIKKAKVGAMFSFLSSSIIFFFPPTGLKVLLRIFCRRVRLVVGFGSHQ